MSEAPLFFLDAPQVHEIDEARAYRVRGAALAIDGPRLETLVLRRDGAAMGETPIALPCPELAPLALEGAAVSRFELEAFLEPGGDYEFVAGGQRLFVLRAPADLARWRELAATVSHLPAPPPQLVRTTQGGADVASYLASAVSGLHTLEQLVDRGSVESVLDIGCGTGRLLLGWHAAGKRQLAGVDINGELIAWNRSALAGVAEWRVCNVEPPLAFGDATFDLIQLASVFTHLPLPLQRAWVLEVRRLLRPGGHAVITLHGSVYARVLLDPASRETYARDGYVEVAGADPGANAFATFHTHAFAAELFAGFKSVRWYPRGNDPALPCLFPIAALQDVYVLQS